MNREEKSVFRWIWISALALAFAGGLSFVLGVFGEAAEVAQEEFGPRALLKKYEQFKDQSAMLDKKVADIGVYEVNLAEFDSMDRKEMDRFDKAEKAQLKLELAGEYLLMAATLLEIKSRLLLPQPELAESGEEEVPASPAEPPSASATRISDGR